MTRQAQRGAMDNRPWQRLPAIPARIRVTSGIAGAISEALGLYEHFETSKHLLSVAGISVPDWVLIAIGVLLILWWLFTPTKDDMPTPIVNASAGVASRAADTGSGGRIDQSEQRATASDHSAAAIGDNAKAEAYHIEHHHYTATVSREDTLKRLSEAFPGRNILSSTPQDVMQVYEGTTTVRGDAVFERAYDGNWIFATTAVGNVAQEYAPGVWPARKAMFVASTIRQGYSTKYLFMYFVDPWDERVKHFTKGDEITVLGRIYKASDSDLKLVDCELVSP